MKKPTMLKEALARGIIPGPAESDESFFDRFSLPIQKTPQEIYDSCVDWVPILYENHGLRFWEGACTWIDECQAVLQMKKRFQYQKRIWGIYPKEELIRHELVHAMRLKFDEPKFEEILAYRQSESWFRRFFGPFFQDSREPFLFFSLACLALIPSLFQMTAPLFFGLFVWGLARLIRRQFLFRKALKMVKKLLQDPSKAEQLMLHLTDREILLFAKGVSIKEYVTKQDSLRWQQIKQSYVFEV